MDFFDDNFICYMIDKTKDNNIINDLIKVIHPSQLQITNLNILNSNDECSICLDLFVNKINLKNKIDKEEKSSIIETIKNINCYCLFEYFLDKNNKSNVVINEICIISCNHMFHKKCILEWLKKSKNCPLCRKNLKIIK